MIARTALSYQYSNTIYLFICFLVFFWLFKAVKRFYRTLLLRYAYTHDSIVQIQGLGSYLSYFDGATSAHLHAVVHTRQTKPPQEMGMVMVPCSLIKATLISDTSERTILEVQVNAVAAGKLILLTNFSMIKFRQAVQSGLHRRKPVSSHFFTDFTHPQQSNSHFRETLFSLEPPSLSVSSATRTCQLSFLAEHEVCDRNCIRHDCMKGTQTVRFSFTNPNGARETGRGNGNMQSEHFTVAIAFLPHNTSEPSAPIRQNRIDLIQDRESDSHSRNSPNKSSTVIFDDTNSSNDSLKELSTGNHRGSASFLNFRSYFSNGSSINSTKRLVVPLESPGTATQGKKEVNNHGYHATESTDSEGNGQKRLLIPHQSELTAVSLFTFQFPVNILSLFPAENNTTNPVIERSASTGSHSKRGSKAQNKIHHTKSSTPAPPPNTNQPYSGPPRSKDVWPKELTIMDKHGKLYNSLEVFGLASMNEGGSNITVGSPVNVPNDSTTAKVSSVNQPSLTTSSSPENPSRLTNRNRSSDTMSGENHRNQNSSTTTVVLRSPASSHEIDVELGSVVSSTNNNTTSEGNPQNPPTESEPPVPITPSTSAIFQGGKYLKEECVICLTDPKNVVLLPCRHLCVCNSCLSFVDKCPVCRAFFEEYVVIQSDHICTVSAE